MKNKLFALTLALMLPACFASAVDINMDVKTDVRVMMDSPAYNPDYSIYFNRNDAVLKLKQETDNMKGYAELDFISWGTRDNSVMNYNSVEPYEIRLNEAYAGFYKVGFDFLDVTIGKQVVSWGSADKLNQVDLLTPYDFSDVLDFNKRLGANMLRADVTAGPVVFEGIYMPSFTPALLSSAVDPKRVVAKKAAGYGIADYSLNYDEPALNLSNSMYAARAGFKVAGVDMHLSYFDGYSSIPFNSNNAVTTELNSSYQIASQKLDSTVIYPKLQVAGFDMASSLFTVGVWAEAGLYIPRDLKTDTTILTLLSNGNKYDPLSSEIEKTVDPYVKYTFGGDYTFGDETYINLQYMHGFFNEYGSDLSNLLLGRVERPFFDEKVKVKLEGGLEIDYNKDKNVTPGALVMPSLLLYPFDSTEVEIGGLKVFANQKDDVRYHLVNTFESLDQLFVKAKYSF